MHNINNSLLSAGRQMAILGKREEKGVEDKFLYHIVTLRVKNIQDERLEVKMQVLGKRVVVSYSSRKGDCIKKYT